MKIILFRSNNIFDSRVNKYYNYYQRTNKDYTVVGWDREGCGIEKDNYDFFHFRAGEDVKGLRAIYNHLRWMLFVYKYLKKHPDVTTVHACDLNSAFPSAIYKVLYNRRLILIFDACDWFSANFSNSKILKFCFSQMERFTYKIADELIICEPERIEQIQFDLYKPPLVMPNIPEIDISLIKDNRDKYKFNNSFPTIAYLGGFSDNRFLLEILSLVETEPFNLIIAGYGYKPVVEKCESLLGRENFKYLGRVKMIDGLEMENSADIIYAMYCKTNQNNIYAAPNKFYEALLLGKPQITTKGTIVEKKVVENNIGWAIDENIEDLRKLIRRLNKEDIRDKGFNALELWQTKFKDYLSDFFDNSYSKIIK